MSCSADLPPAHRSAHLSTSCAGRWASGTCITVSWSSSHVGPVSRGCLGLECFTGALLSVARHWDAWNIGHPQLPAPMAGKVAFGATWYLCPESRPGGSATALTGRSWGPPAGTSGDCLGKILSAIICNKSGIWPSLWVPLASRAQRVCPGAMTRRHLTMSLRSERFSL